MQATVRREEDGIVVMYYGKCIGCGMCIGACPYDARFFNPIGQTADKCDFCVRRVDKGLQPACVEACPHEALAFGDRDQLIAKARALIENYPKRYHNRVWGETEWGGTSLIYLSSEPLDALGWPNPAMRAPISALTDPLIHATPLVGIGVLLGSWGLGAVIARRNKLMKNGNDRKNSDSRARKQEDGNDE